MGLTVGDSPIPQPATRVGVHWLLVKFPCRGSISVLFVGGGCQLAAVLGATSGRHGANVTNLLDQSLYHIPLK